MCSIDKLLIKGVRSFSPDNQNVIEFYRPLTLIVGQNGAGKTVSTSVTSRAHSLTLLHMYQPIFVHVISSLCTPEHTPSSIPPARLRV